MSARLLALGALTLLALGQAACGSAQSGPSRHRAATAGKSAATTTTTATTPTLPGTGRPQVTIGDKNFTEQFVLGQLYLQALKAEGFAVVLDRNIGPTDVTVRALANGTLSMYPEYLDTFNTVIAGDSRSFQTPRAAYRAAQRFALSRGLALLHPTPYSYTSAIGVTVAYAHANGLRTIADLRRVAPALTLGAPPQFQDPAGLPALEQAYGFVPAAFKALGIGAQYEALDMGSVQAADVNTTDGQLSGGGYLLLTDPQRVFGWGEETPVVSAKVLADEGPAFAARIDAVSALLTTTVMRGLNAAVDVSHQDPAAVAKAFLQAHGLAAATGS
ncbi:MAG: glycine betaine ABC transporter substrate-binding protein [Solirubrobacteraceae bacterium]